MDKFTKLNLNGVDKFVSAIYDGSGNEIVSTYETKTDSTSKQEAINQSINTTNTNLSALEARVVETEKYKTTIDSNTSNIQKNEAAITALQATDTKFGEDLDALVIRVGEDETLINTNKTNIGNVQTLTIGLQTDVNLLKASVNDEAMGLVALNAQADKNTADIATLTSDVEVLKGAKTTNEGAIVSLQAQQQTNTSDIATNTQDIAGIKQTLAQLQPQVESNNQSIEAIRGDIGTHTEELGKLKEVTDPLPAKVQSLGEAFDKINGDVQGMKSSLDDKISKDLYEALLERIAVLEAAIAKYHPEEQPTE